MSKCVEAYCINSPDETVTLQIGISETSFQYPTALDGLGNPTGWVDRTSFEMPYGSSVVFWNLTAEAHSISFDNGTPFNIPVSGSATSAAINTGQYGVFSIKCLTHLDEGGQPSKTATLRIYYPGAFDLNQSAENNENGKGCCRASIRLTVRARYNGFTDFAGSVYPKYLKRRIKTKFYSWTSPGGAGVVTSWRGGNITPGTVIKEVSQLYAERIRSPFFSREGRPEYTYLDDAGNVGGDNVLFAAYAGQFVGGRLEYTEVGEEIFNTKEFFLSRGPWNQTSPTRRERDILWYYWLDFDYESEPILDSVIGIEVDEFLEPYQWDDFAAKLVSLIESAGPAWDLVEYPNCEALIQFRNYGDLGSTLLAGSASGPCVMKGGIECCQLPTENTPGNPRQYLYDDGVAEGANVWPLPNVFPECDVPGVCGGFGDTQTPYPYGCVTEDILNSERYAITGDGSIFPANANSADNIGHYRTLIQPMWAVGSPSSPYKNFCASAQLNDDIVSPPVHLMSSITYDTTGNGILVTWQPVKRWWNAAFCRRVYEDKGSGAALVHCEHSADGFEGPNIIPPGAAFDVNGEYEVTGLTTGATYQFNTQLAPVAGETLTHSTSTFEFGHFTKAEGQSAIIHGPPDQPVASVLRPNTTLAPCGRIDDVAHDVNLYPAEDGLSSDWSILGWHAVMGAGQVWTRLAEMDCPDYSLGTNPPCGCDE